MKMFRDLSVFCGRDSLDPLISQIETLLTHGWSRDRMRESKFSPLFRKPIFCFLRSSNGECPAVVLLMTAESYGVSVSNIVPNGRELSCDQYNSILTEFYLRFLQPAASQNSLAVELSSDELGIKEGFGSKAAQLLKAFSETANKSATQPGDRCRWFAFLISLHDRPTHSDYSDLLADRLRKDSWPEDKADKLISELEFARDLLPAYDHHRSSGDQASANGSTIPLSFSDVGLEEVLGTTAVHFLKVFSVIANKSVTHPCDRLRWFIFLIYLHNHPTDNHYADLLEDWLLRDRWSEKKASRLVCEMEFTRDLLRAYDHNLSRNNQAHADAALS